MKPSTSNDRPLAEALKQALSAGDPQEVKALLDRGADIRYRYEHGYEALIHAVHSRDVFRDTRLLDLLHLLIDRGANLDAVSTYGE
jgi:hypothetical protein